MSPPHFNRYHASILRAREVGLALAGVQEEALLALLAEFTEELVRLVRAGIATDAETALAGEVQRLFAALAVDAQTRVRQGVRLTAERCATIHAQATADLIRAVRPVGADGIAGRLAFSMRAVNVEAAQAVLSRPEFSEAFVSIADADAAGANRVLHRGLLRGAPTAAIERELRMYVGAPGSLVGGDEEMLSDLRRISYGTLEELGYVEPTYQDLLQVRRDAGAVRNRVQLIARTEVMGAQHEAHVRSVEASPVVAAVRVSLSYSHPVPDQCDTAAHANLYSLGPGLYPPGKVPARFHPRCLCKFTDVLLPVDEWGAERPPPPPLSVDWDELRKAYALTPSQVSSLEASISIGEARWAGSKRKPVADSLPRPHL
ncbi:MAG TPA: hypothetical protein VFR37_10755 [Longimicrobium sp.]|nr:hypothetical protein [Longimicrobium sp.]